MKTEVRKHLLVMAVFRWSALLAVACTVIALLLDLYHWAADGSPWLTSEPWRFARTVLCAVPAFLAMSLRNNRDVHSVFIAMLLAILADLFLVLLHNLIIGIAIFAVMQVVLIHRHLRGGAVHAYFRPPLIRAVAIGAVVILVGNGLLWSPLSAKGLALPVLVYSTLLLTSTVTAFGAGHTKVLAATASRQAFWGMVLFVLCDITVGIGAAFGHMPEGELVRSLTGLFYTPSLLLLVRSGLHPPATE